jgi:glycosyltransferase involved in cell wall biosynthesis
MRMYRDASAVVCVTESFVRTLKSRGIRRSKLFFVPNGIEPAFWESSSRADGRTQLHLDDDDVLASYVGTIGMAHGLSTVLAAAAQLQTIAPRVKLLIVGDGAELAALRAAAARDGLSNVRFTGLVSRDRVPGILAATDLALVTLKPSDVFKTVLPSKMFEAMAAKCAVVLGVDGEARATLERADAGVFVKPGDAGALSRAIADLAADPDRRARMGIAGSQFVAREFSRRAWAARYVDVLIGIKARSAAAEPVTIPFGE